MDSKKSLQDSDPWTTNVEQEIFGNQPPYAAKVDQEIFGNQPPYAAGSGTLPDTPQDHQHHRQYQDAGEEEAPYLAHPYQPHMIPPQKAIHPTAPSTGTDAFRASSFPLEAPPMYSPTPATPTPVVAPLVPPQSPQSSQGADRTTAPPLQSPEISPRTIRSLPSLQQPTPQSANLPTDHTSVPHATQPPLPHQQRDQQQQQQQQYPYPYASQSYGAISPQVLSIPRQSRSFRNRGSNSSSSSSVNSDSEGSEDDELLSSRQLKNKYPIRCKHGKSRCSKRTIFLVLLFGTLIYYFFFVLMEDPCKRAQRLEVEEETYTFMYRENTTITLSIQDDIPGNILVKENDDWGEGVFFVSALLTSADHNVIDYIKHDYTLEDVLWTTHLRLGTEEPEELLKRIKKTCTRSDIVVTLPKGYSSGRSMNLVTSQGDIMVQWKNTQIMSEEISLHATGGRVILDGLSVRTKTDIAVSGAGSVSGVLSTTGQIIVSTEVGDIDLELDTDVGLIGEPQKNLDVSLSTKTKGHINLVHTRDYSGYFALNSGLGDAALMYPPNSSIPIFTQKSNAHKEGWLTEDGSKPSSDIPVVKASTYEGPISMTILDSSIPRRLALKMSEPKD